MATRGDSPSNSLMQKRLAAQYLRYNSTNSEYEESDFHTANEVFPMRISLETVQIGAWKYTSKELDDIELLYELESSDLLVKTNIGGTQDALPGMFRIKNVTASDLSLLSVVPGSLESMVSRLVIETDQKIAYSPCVPPNGVEGDGKGSADDRNEQLEDSSDLDVYMVRMTASVHETGHLRDILLFWLKRDCQVELFPASPFLRERSPAADSDSAQEEEKPSSTPSQLTLVEGLPYWVLYIPWMLYSKKVRVFLQRLLVLYTVLSVLWAMWQLYRHVHIIRVIIQPVIATLKYYLSSVFDIMDWLFAVFTLWWNTFLSPLNVLRGLLLAPMIQVLVQLKGAFAPLYQVFLSSGLISALVSIFSLLYRTFYFAGSSLWMVLRTILMPVKYVVQSFLNSRFMVATVDIQRLRLSWVFNLLLSSLRSILRGLMALVGYQRQEKKIKKARENNASSPIVSPVSTPSSAARQRHKGKMPMLYSSPLSKQQ